MGLLGSLARRSASAALYGSGRLVSVVVPDRITPWNLRRTASHTSNSLLRLGLREMKKRKKKKPTKKRPSASGRSSTSSPKRTSIFSFLGSAFSGRKGQSKNSVQTTAPFLVVHRSTQDIHQDGAGNYLAPVRKTAARGPRASTTKGKTNFSRRAPVAASAPVILIQSPSNEHAPRFNKNAWSSGRGLRSSADWDTPSPSAIAAAKRRRSRVARSGGKLKTRRARR
jgi:hypothetical protein